MLEKSGESNLGLSNLSPHTNHHATLAKTEEMTELQTKAFFNKALYGTEMIKTSWKITGKVK